jgi:hypothetical protein
MEMAKNNAELQIALTQKLNDDIAKIDKEANDKKLADEKELQDKKMQMAMDGVSADMSLVDSFSAHNEKQAKAQFAVNKAFSLAQAIMSTYQAVNNALTAGGNPAKLATGMQFVEAGIALTSGLASVVKIAKTKFEPSGGGGPDPSGGGGGGGLQLAGGAGGGAQFNIVGNSGFNQMSQLQQQPIKAYVVGNEVTSQQALDRNRIANATL